MKRLDRIAVIAWGSLVWDPRELAIEAAWAHNGPTLPIEFSRISKDGRLTLAIDVRDGVPIKCWTNVSSYVDVKMCVTNLAQREQAELTGVGFVDVDNGMNSSVSYPTEVDVHRAVANWCGSHGVGGAVWTALRPNFSERTGVEFSVDHAVSYVKASEGDTRSRVLEYIRRAPPTTLTPVRKALRLHFDV